MSGYGYFPINLYLQRQTVDQNCFSIHSLPTLDMEPCRGQQKRCMSMWGTWMPPILQGPAQVWHFQVAALIPLQEVISMALVFLSTKFSKLFQGPWKYLGPFSWSTGSTLFCDNPTKGFAFFTLILSWGQSGIFQRWSTMKSSLWLLMECMHLGYFVFKKILRYDF